MLLVILIDELKNQVKQILPRHKILYNYFQKAITSQKKK